MVGVRPAIGAAKIMAAEERGAVTDLSLLLPNSATAVNHWFQDVGQKVGVLSDHKSPAHARENCAHLAKENAKEAQTT